MPSLNRIFPAVAILLGLLLRGHDTSAQPQPHELYERGAAAYREARYEEALELLQQAHEIEPHQELAYDLGRTYEALGKLAPAIDSFRQYLELAPDAEDRSAVEVRIQNLVERMLARRPRVTITSRPSGAKVRTDDRVIGVTPYSGRLDAGTHFVTLERSGYQIARRGISLREGESVTMHLELDALDPDPEVATEADSQRASVGLPTWIAFGAAAAALGTAVVFEAARRNAERETRDAATQLEHTAHYRAAVRNRDAARAFLAIGSVSAVTGGALLVFDLRGSF